MTRHLDTELLSVGRTPTRCWKWSVCTSRGSIRAHLKWEAGTMISRLNADDLTTGELAAFIAVLHAADARVITPPAGDRPLLRIIPKGHSNESGTGSR
jgi:hypothetical protein